MRPHELGADDAKCRISHYASEGGDFIESWTWQYDASNGRPTRLTYDVPGDRDLTAVFDERGRYWSVCGHEGDCLLFDEPASVDWDIPYAYAETCPGTPPEAGYEQLVRGCYAPASRKENCDDGRDERQPFVQTWQLTEARQVRRVIPDLPFGSADVDCFVDGVLRATGYQGDFSSLRREYFADGRLKRITSDEDIDEGAGRGEAFSACDESGWLAEHRTRTELYPEDSTLRERYSFRGDDPLRPDEVVFEFEQTDLNCIPPIDRRGTLTAKLEWKSDAVEVHPDENSDPLLQGVSWTARLNPETLSAKVDDDGNVVEFFAAPRSNLQELGLRQLGPDRIGVYVFEGEGACVRGENPHLLLAGVGHDANSIVTGVSPDRTSAESCSTGEVRVTGYEQVCEDYGADE